MHNMYGIIFIISNIIVWISSAPTTNEHKLIYELLIDHSSLKCPYLKATALLDPVPSFLKHCSDYSTLKAVKSLTRETEYDILCILYMNNYINLCNSLPINSTVNNKDIQINRNTTNFEKTCKTLSNSKFIDDFKDAANILSYFKSAETCKSLCKEVTASSVTPICSLAAFTLNLAIQIQQNPVKIEPQKSSVNVNQSKSLIKENQAVAAVPKPQITNNNGEINSNIKSIPIQPQNQDAPQSNLPADPAQRVAVAPKQTQEMNHPVGPVIPKTGLNPQKDSKSNDNSVIKQNPVATHAKDPLPETAVKDEVGQEENAAEILSTKTPDVKKDIMDETKENQQLQPQPVDQKEKSAQEVQSDQRPSTQAEVETSPVQNAKNVDSTDVKDNIMSQLDDTPLNGEDDIEEEGDFIPEPEKSASKVKQQPKPQETDEDVLSPPYNSSNSDEEDSFFFIYFMMVCAVFILGYLGYHNKQKVLALVIEGRRGRRGSRRGRPNSANYHKLDSNLEEAVTSSCNKNTTNIIY